MKKTIYSLSALLMLSLLTSCSEDSIKTSQDAYKSTQSKLETIEGATVMVPTTATLADESSFRSAYTADDEFAKMLAVSLNSADFRKFIKEEAEKKFDGDYDILVSKVLNAKIGGQNFSSMLKASHTQGADVFSRVTKNEYLNISVPVEIEKWDTKAQTLLVANAIDYIDGETERVKAWDGKGNVYWIDAKVEPNYPVVVVGNNERLDFYEEYFAEQARAKNARTSGNTERVEYIRCPNLDAIEGWLKGAPEIRFDGVVYNKTFSAAFQAFIKMEIPPARHNAKNGYTLALHTNTLNLFNWHFDENHGPDYYIQTFEIDDKGKTQEVSVAVTAKDENGNSSGTSSYKLTYKAEDIKMAGELIHYTRPNVSWVSDGLIEFRLEN